MAPLSQGEWIDEWMNWANFLHADENPGKLRSTLIIFGLVVLKNGNGTLIPKCMNESGWFFACYRYARQLKVTLIVIG